MMNKRLCYALSAVCRKLLSLKRFQVPLSGRATRSQGPCVGLFRSRTSQISGEKSTRGRNGTNNSRLSSFSLDCCSALSCLLSPPLLFRPLLPPLSSSAVRSSPISSLLLCCSALSCLLSPPLLFSPLLSPLSSPAVHSSPVSSLLLCCSAISCLLLCCSVLSCLLSPPLLFSPLMSPLSSSAVQPSPVSFSAVQSSPVSSSVVQSSPVSSLLLCCSALSCLLSSSLLFTPFLSPPLLFTPLLSSLVFSHLDFLLFTSCYFSANGPFSRHSLRKFCKVSH